MPFVPNNNNNNIYDILFLDSEKRTTRKETSGEDIRVTSVSESGRQTK